MLTRVLDSKNAHFPVNSSVCNWRFCWSSCLASAVEMLACPRGWMTTRSHLSSGVLIFCFIIGNKQILQLSCPMLSRCKRLKLALGFWSNEIQNTKKYPPQKKTHKKPVYLEAFDSMHGQKSKFEIKKIEHILCFTFKSIRMLCSIWH